MKVYFEDPTLRLVLFEMHDVLTSSENPDEGGPDDGNDTDTIWN